MVCWRRAAESGRQLTTLSRLVSDALGCYGNWQILLAICTVSEYRSQ